MKNKKQGQTRNLSVMKIDVLTNCFSFFLYYKLCVNYVDMMKQLVAILYIEIFVFFCFISHLLFACLFFTNSNLSDDSNNEG